MDYWPTLRYGAACEAARKVLRELGLARLEPMAHEAQPSVRLIASVAEPHAIPVGQSKLGGRPDLPARTPWPMVEARLATYGEWGISAETGTEEFIWFDEPIRWCERYPLAFVAQVNLAEIAPFELPLRLPASGWLSFFFDSTHGFGEVEEYLSGTEWKVIFSSCPAEELQRAQYPGALAQQSRFTARRVRPVPEVTLPYHLPFEPEQLQALGLPPELTDDEYDEYLLQAHPRLMRLEEDERLPIHRICGHPQPIQGDDMNLDCQLESHGIHSWDDDPRKEALGSGASDWRLLLRIDSEPGDDGFSWGDWGRLYYWIREQDLQERNFDQAWMVLQCH
jgi:uncharacterized protein YwqG